MPDLIYKLIEFYYKYDKFQDRYMSFDDAFDYHRTILDKNLVITYVENDELLGYGEFWRINEGQLGKLVLGKPIFPVSEDVESGNICVLMNVTIRPDKRMTRILLSMRDEFFKVNKYCDYFVGHALRKKHQPWKVFSKQEAFMKFGRMIEEKEFNNGKH